LNVADEFLLDGLDILTNGAEDLRQIRGNDRFLCDVAQWECWVRSARSARKIRAIRVIRVIKNSGVSRGVSTR
jgi:hypothetical protein